MGNGPNLSLAFKKPLNIFLRIIFSRKKKRFGSRHVYDTCSPCMSDPEFFPN